MNRSTNTTNILTTKKIAGSYLLAIISFVILVFIDQASKYYIVHTMNLHDSISVIDGVFEIHYIQNRGAAWGLFENQQLLFFCSTIIACFICIIFYVKSLYAYKLKMLRFTLVLILSGGIGNMIDRIRFQYVIDFIYVKLIDFPVFNIADCYVTIGFFIILVLILFIYKDEDLECLSFKKKNR